MERMGASDLFNKNANLTDFSESTKLKCLVKIMGIDFNCNHLNQMNIEVK